MKSLLPTNAAPIKIPPLLVVRIEPLLLQSLPTNNFVGINTAASPTANVYESTSESNTDATGTSPITMINDKMNTTARIGTDKGKRTNLNACHGVAPSRAAASSRELSMVSKYPLIVHVKLSHQDKRKLGRHECLNPKMECTDRAYQTRYK